MSIAAVASYIRSAWGNNASPVTEEQVAGIGSPVSVQVGASVFAKNCAACHNNASSGAPQLPIAGHEFSGAAMVSVLWKHGPNMLDQMKTKGIEWPRFDGAQMADLIAYLNGNKAGHR